MENTFPVSHLPDIAPHCDISYSPPVIFLLHKSIYFASCKPAFNIFFRDRMSTFFYPDRHSPDCLFNAFDENINYRCVVITLF